MRPIEKPLHKAENEHSEAQSLEMRMIKSTKAALSLVHSILFASLSTE
jgi:hypothetical protein